MLAGPSDSMLCRLGVKATTWKAKAKDLTFKAKDLTFEAKAKGLTFKANAKDLIPEHKVGYQNQNKY